MKILFETPVWLIIAIFFCTIPVYGEDMRAVSRKAKADYEAARAEDKGSEERILKDR